MEQMWMRDAACRADDVDPEVFFPVSQLAVNQIEAAKEVCRDCPVRVECLSWSLAVGMPNGVLGGLDEWERDALIRRTRHPATVVA